MIASLERKHDHNGEEQGHEGERADTRDEVAVVPCAAFGADEDGASEESGEKRNAQVDKDAGRDFADGDMDDLALQAELCRKNGDEDPRVERIEEDLEK